MSDQLNSFIEAQHAQNLIVMQALGRIEQAQKDTSQRLLGGDSQQGAIPYLSAKVEKVSDRVGKLEIWKTGTLRWVAGVVAVLTVEGGLLAFYFSHVSSRVQAISDLIKTTH